MARKELRLRPRITTSPPACPQKSVPTSAKQAQITAATITPAPVEALRYVHTPLESYMEPGRNPRRANAQPN